MINLSDELTLTPVAYIYNDFTGSFGIPRQGGIAESVISKIVFTPEFRDENALRGIEQYSHLWLIWGFSENYGKEWSPTVRPPKLGGNKRLGVFATRSPFRPNNLGLSSVELKSVEKSRTDGTYLTVSGADLKNGTPIYDIKPYIPYADIKENAVGGFAEEHKNDRAEVIINEKERNKMPGKILEELIEILSLDPKPQYKDDCKIYGISFGGYEIKFTSFDGKVTVTDIEEEK